MSEIYRDPAGFRWGVCGANEESFQQMVAAMGYERQPSQYEEVKSGERRELSRSEFERFENGQLGFVCNGERMKPQKVNVAGFENTMEMWWVEFMAWPKESK
jgi:hypothetical protein